MADEQGECVLTEAWRGSEAASQPPHCQAPLPPFPPPPPELCEDKALLCSQQQVCQQLCRENLGPSQMGRPGPHVCSPLKVTEPVNGEEVNRTKVPDIILPGLGSLCPPHNQVGTGGDLGEGWVWGRKPSGAIVGTEKPLGKTVPQSLFGNGERMPDLSCLQEGGTVCPEGQSGMGKTKAGLGRGAYATPAMS